jgi:hypothetical protein
MTLASCTRERVSAFGMWCMYIRGRDGNLFERRSEACCSPPHSPGVERRSGVNTGLTSSCGEGSKRTTVPRRG